MPRKVYLDTELSPAQEHKKEMEKDTVNTSKSPIYPQIIMHVSRSQERLCPEGRKYFHAK